MGNISEQYKSEITITAHWRCDNCGRHAVTEDHYAENRLYFDRGMKIAATLPEGWVVSWFNSKADVYCGDCYAEEFMDEA